MTTADDSAVKYVSANGMRLAYTEIAAAAPDHTPGATVAPSGSADARRAEPPALILLHGAMVGAWMWRPVAPLLDRRYRVLLPDLRGHGHSDNPTGEMSYPLLAADVAAFVAALELHAPVIAGWSMGGFVTIELGLRFPGTARALVAGGVAMALPAAYEATMRDLYAIDVAGTIDLDRFARERPELVMMMEQSHGAGRWRDLLPQYTAMDAPYRRPGGGQRMYTPAQVRSLADPLLLMAADRDEFIPITAAATLYQHAPRAELAVLPGTTHLAPWERPGIVAAVLNDYLARLLPTP